MSASQHWDRRCVPLHQVWLLKFLLSRTFLGPNNKLIPLNILSLGCRVYTWRSRVPASKSIKDRHCPAECCGQYQLLGGPSLTLEVIVPIPLFSTLALGNGQKSACFPSLLVSDCSTLAAQNQVSNTKFPGGQQTAGPENQEEQRSQLERSEESPFSPEFRPFSEMP